MEPELSLALARAREAADLLEGPEATRLDILESRHAHAVRAVCEALERTHGQVTGPVPRDVVAETTIRSMEVTPGGGIDMVLEPPHWAVKALALSFGKSLADAPNWQAFRVDLTDENAGHMIVTIQRADGETPVELVTKLRAELAALRDACAREDHDIQQTLGKALGYSRFADDPKNFPDATEADGVCVGDHVAASLAAEAADRIETLAAERDEGRTAACQGVRNAVLLAREVIVLAARLRAAGVTDETGRGVHASDLATLLATTWSEDNPDETVRRAALEWLRRADAEADADRLDLIDREVLQVNRCVSFGEEGRIAKFQVYSLFTNKDGKGETIREALDALRKNGPGGTK
jgi:hypothetical protein